MSSIEAGTLGGPGGQFEINLCGKVRKRERNMALTVSSADDSWRNFLSPKKASEPVAFCN